MIGFLPTLYDDELLYSAFARYSDLVDYPSSAAVVRDLFHDVNASAVVDFPSRLNNFIAALPQPHVYSVDRLIYQNTFFPFYAPFLPLSRITRLKQDMVGSHLSFATMRVGNTAGLAKRSPFLRFCPRCSGEDRNRYRETYWHRVHQLPGVEVCHIHKVFLENTTVPLRNPTNPRIFSSAEASVSYLAARPLESNNSSHRILLKIASDASWLLQWRGPTPDSSILRNRYFNALLKMKLACHAGRIRFSRLQNAFLKLYSAAFLAQIGCSIAERNSWLGRLLNTCKVDVVQAPLCHLLLINFLGYTAEEFFTAYQDYKPFGSGPWPCLNPACNYYRRRIIKRCLIKDSKDFRRTRTEPHGTFACVCGFVYTRFGPDGKEDASFRRDSVQSYGPLWEQKLKELWNDITIPVHRVATMLGSGQLTLKRHAIRL